MKMRRTQGAKRSTDRREYCSSELSWKRLADTSSFSLPSGSASFLDSVGETGLGGTATMRVKGSSTSSLLMTLSACRMSAARRSATVRLRSAAAGAASPATSPAAPSSAGAGSTASAWSGRSISISAPAWFLSLACFEAGSASAPACSATSKSTTSSPSPASTCRSALSASAATSAAAAPAPCSSSCPSSATAATATTSAWLLCNVCSAGCSTWALHIVPARRPVCCCWCWCCRWGYWWCCNSMGCAAKGTAFALKGKALPGWYGPALLGSEPGRELVGMNSSASGLRAWEDEDVVAVRGGAPFAPASAAGLLSGLVVALSACSGACDGCGWGGDGDGSGSGSALGPAGLVAVEAAPDTKPEAAA
eukprot:m.231244 g.231244  ORF g.231244 m.231244 type:complete len:365 (-) comp22421_c19_seq2:1100-2194(-)